MTSRSTRNSELRGAARLVFVVLLAWLGWVHAARVIAEPADPLDLVWSAPKGCASAEEVRARVRKLAGATEPAARVTAEGTVKRKTDGELHLHLVIHVDQRVGQRELDGKTCSDLAGAAAVALALVMRSPDPLGSEGPETAAPDSQAALPTTSAATGQASTDQGAPAAPTSSSSSPSPSPPPTPSESAEASPARAPSESAEASRAPRTMHALLQLPLFSIAFGPLPTPSYGFAAGAGMSIGRFQWLAEGRAWLPQRVSATQDAERYGADVQRFAGGLRGCVALLWSRLQLLPCVLVSVEHLSARGTGRHVASQVAKATWFAAGLGLRARVGLTRFVGVLTGVDLQVHTSRPHLAVDGVGLIQRLWPVAASLTLGLEWNL